MSLASCSYQCGWIADDVTFTVSLLGTQGDLYQRFSGTSLSPNNIQPNWNGLSQGSGPVLRVLVMESDPTITQASIAKQIVDSETSYYVDGNRLTFNSNGLSAASSTSDPTYPYNGLFRKLLANSTGVTGNAARTPTLASAPFGGLEVRGNLVTATGGKTVNVTVSLGIETSAGTAIHKQGGTQIRMITSNGSSNFAHIYCDDDQFVLIEETNPDVVCRVKCWKGDTEVTGTFYRKWYMLEGGQWVQKATTDTFTVNRDMVATFADIKVECYEDSARTKLIASDVQTINDSSDALVLNPCPNPPDGNFEQGSGKDITFSPTLVNNDGSAVSIPHKFIYTVIDSVGNILLSIAAANAISPGGSFTVSHEVADGIKEAPVVIIEAIEA